MKQSEYIYNQKASLTRLVQGTDNLCVYFIPQRRGIYAQEVARRHGLPTVMENMPEQLLHSGSLAPQSVETWKNLFAAIEGGDKTGSAHISLIARNGTPTRYWIHFNGIADEDGTPALALIFFGDISAEYRNTGLRSNDIEALLLATQKTFPEVLTLNLTRNTYRMVQYDGATTLGTAREGPIDDMINLRLRGGVAEEDRAGFAAAFSAESLRTAFLRDGKEAVQLMYRRLDQEGNPHWYETTVIHQQNHLDSDLLVVAMSRNVDAQKAEEGRLREHLRVQTEELRLTLSQVGKAISYYDIPTSTLTTPQAQARLTGLPEVLPNFPESYFEQAPTGFSPLAAEAIYTFYAAIRRGEPTGTCEYRRLDLNGTERWERLEFASIFDANGRPLRAVIAVEDTTDRHVQTAENRQLKENERLLRLIAQHSDRLICHYDIQKEKARIWDPNTCDQCPLPRLCEMTPREILDSGDILPESVEELRGFFQDIHAGKPGGSMKLRAKTKSGERRWFDLQYSTVYDEEDIPVSALISHKDITEQYEHELAYLRQAQSLEKSENHLGTIDVDLTADLIEKQGGRMAPPGAQAVGRSLTDFGRRMVSMKLLEQDQAEGLQFYSRAYLLSQYSEGSHQLTRVWQMRFRNGTLRWVHTMVELMDDPYTGHIKAFFRMTDITEEMEARLAVEHRSNRDGMTGLLNRAAAEDQIRSRIAQKEAPGILILLDLDDLKGINDTFGHNEGDRAILGIAKTLKSHFRDSDVIGRIGGDEFILYLPGASENKEAIAVSLVALLRKLATLPIGSHDERRIHCSIGCAVQTDSANSFELLYKQADTALYHVKRGGKNNFAFYSPNMDQEDYQFQAEKLFSMQTTKKFQLAELQHLLGAISSFYQLVLSVNLSSNDYYLMEEIDDGVFSRIPAFGVLDDYVKMTLSMVHPNDGPGFTDHLSRKALLQAYAQGEHSVRHYFRFRNQERYLWVEATAIFYTDQNGDVCDFTLVRWADERAAELEQLYCTK